jgi:hypothetical protein
MDVKETDSKIKNAGTSLYDRKDCDSVREWCSVRTTIRLLVSWLRWDNKLSAEEKKKEEGRLIKRKSIKFAQICWLLERYSAEF